MPTENSVPINQHPCGTLIADLVNGLSLLASTSESKGWQSQPRPVVQCIHVQGVGVAKELGVNYIHRSPQGNRHMRRILNQAANAAVKAKGSIFEIVCRRSVPRLGHKQTIGAIAHRQCRLIWLLLHQAVRYDGASIAALARSMKANLGVHRVAPAHCTGNLAFKILKQEFGENYSYAAWNQLFTFRTETNVESMDAT